MIKIVFNWALPLSLLSFRLISKWWYGNVIDGSDEFFLGFPFIYKCRGFHTSLSTQYFLMEMVSNFLCYLIFWCIVGYMIRRKISFSPPQAIIRLFWFCFAVYVLGFIHLSKEMDDRFSLYRDFDVEIIDTGIAVFESHPTRNTYQHP